MKTKLIVAVILVLTLCFAFCACGMTRDKAVGTWSGTYEYNGNYFSVSFVLSSDGEYSYISYKNGDFNKSETGTWEIEDGAVVLHVDGNTSKSTIYEYDGDALVNNNHKFYKD